MQPFSGVLPSATTVDLVEQIFSEQSSSQHGLEVRPEHQSAVRSVLQAVAKVNAEGTLLSLNFESIFDYLQVRRTDQGGCHACTATCASTSPACQMHHAYDINGDDGDDDGQDTRTL